MARITEISYSYIDISPEHKEALKRKAEEWKRLVEKYQICVNNRARNKLKAR